MSTVTRDPAAASHSQHQLVRGPRSSLSLVWIAATLGPKAHLKRISKRQLVSLNVPAACRLIAEPAADGETLPLRISSTLLSGVSRVYGQQYKLHFNNVINVIDQIRLHLSSKRQVEVSLQSKLSEEHRIETITLPLLPDIDIFGAGIGGMPAILPPGTPIAPAAYPEEHLPSAPASAFRAGTPSMEMGRALAATPLGAGLTSDFSTSDFGGYGMGPIMLPESASGRPGVPTISELAMAEEREHGIMDLDLGLDLPPIPAALGGHGYEPGMGFERMSPLLQALPTLSSEPTLGPMFGQPSVPPLIHEEPEAPLAGEEPLEDLEPLPKRRRVAGPRHPRLDPHTELPGSFWRHPPVVQAGVPPRVPTPPRGEILDHVLGPLVPGFAHDFARVCQVSLFARQSARREREETYPEFGQRFVTPEPEARRAMSMDIGMPGDVSIEEYRPPYAFGIHDLTAEEAGEQRLSSDLQSPGRLGGFLLPVSPIMGPAGLTSDISSMAGPETQLLFPPSPQLQPMREATEEPTDITATQSALAMEQQSLNFLEQTKVLLEASATAELAFDDLLPVRTKTVAAQAFYHLLTLVTQDKLRVDQNAPYDTIYVRNVDEQ